MSIVKKRDGSIVPLDLSKFHLVVANACEGITGVSASEVEMASQIQFYPGIQTRDIQETLINAASKLISEDTPNYQHVAGRLVNYQLRKEAYGTFTPPKLYDHCKKLVKKKIYDRDIFNLYSKYEFDLLDQIVDHTRDESLTFAAMEQFRGKYLCKDRTTGEIFETPQMAYILIAATLFGKYPRNTRMQWVKEYYDAISTHELTIPTPILGGVRTPERQYSSCVLIEADDSLDSMIAATGAVVKYVSARAGIGLGTNIRAEGDSVKGGSKKHTGGTPFIKMYQAAVKSCSQGGLRGGSATYNFVWFHRDVSEYLSLKNDKGTDDNSARHLDYVIQMNRLFYERYLRDENITLFSPADVPELMKAFYDDSGDFERLYLEAEQAKIRKRVIPAKELMDQIVTERFGTGRIYILNVDHVNSHGPYIPSVAPIRMTNLCVEITGATSPLAKPNEEIALCTLHGINAGVVKIADLPRVARLAVHALNAVIDYQDYQHPAAEYSTKKRRPIGIGIMGLAYWMVKNNSTFSQPNLNALDEYLEEWSYAIIEASCDWAEDFGACPGFNETRWSLGRFPIDTYKRTVDTICDRKPTKDWEALRARVMVTGVGNSTLMAFMPGESSSDIANAPSGVDPVRSLITIKGSKDGQNPKVVPEFKRYKNKYEPLWSMPSMEGQLKVNAILQKWIDQSGSFNTSYNPSNYPNEIVPEDVLVRDILTAYRYGIKSLYYNNCLAISNDEAAPESCEGCSL